MSKPKIMLKNFIDQKYHTIAKYYFLGIILAVIVYQFVTNSIINNGIDINSLVGNEIMKYIVSALAGGFVGGLIYVLMTINKNDRQIREENYWVKIKDKKSLLFITNIFAFSIGGFIYSFITNLLNLNSFDNIISDLFSRTSIVEYLGMMLAAAVFSLLLSIGINKRLNLLYEK